ncbi:MAG TPA: cytochrome ubiquinol oxidase subunit I, partial [Gammaproteobacteria bacterium]|nr:cytochrome ubiquinol oxidase subunit I [Gammaproteobacteria bacterium]
RSRIQDGIVAYNALTTLQHNPDDHDAELILNIHQENLGYGLLLKRYTEDVAHASKEMIEKAAWDTVPSVTILFWAFRVMAGLGFFFILLFGLAYYFTVRRRALNRRWFLWLAFLSLPLPWLASEVGWIVAEFGRQPWVVEGELPTFLAASSLPLSSLWISISGFIFFYTLLAFIEIYLMVKYIRLGPEALFKEAAFEMKKVEH